MRSEVHSSNAPVADAIERASERARASGLRRDLRGLARLELAYRVFALGVFATIVVRLLLTEQGEARTAIAVASSLAFVSLGLAFLLRVRQELLRHDLRASEVDEERAHWAVAAPHGDTARVPDSE